MICNTSENRSMNHTRILFLAALAALAACQPKSGVTTADASPPVATVDGSPISRDFYEFYIKGITSKSSSELTPQQRELALDNLIRARLVAEEAAKEGLDKSSDTAWMLELSRLNVLQQAVLDRYLKDRKPSEQELRAEYETQVASTPRQEYHARHILVATEPFAEKLVTRLDKGEKFDVLAKQESMDPSKSNGGDLGWFSPDRMVPEFAGALIALKPGQYTHKPIQTQYGWHIIQLLETRELTPPPFDQVRAQLQKIVENKKFRTYSDELMHHAKIEKLLDKPSSGQAAGAPAAAPRPAAETTAAPAAAPAVAPAPAAAPAPKG
ncbi:MAG: peptidylprolyl isomerase [Gammaproteobacteria bacterium]|nr:MAG: peptidylprolyl isomerase [Gammaproteobacteria bacterium]TLY71489.1 MAG: peptidylprolyl isomerase [Gammaproteobacteria bacterium]